MQDTREKLDELFVDKLAYDFVGTALPKPNITDKENLLELSLEYEAGNIKVILAECQDQSREFQKALIKHFKEQFPDSHFLFVSNQGKVFDLYNLSSSKKLKAITYNEIDRNTKLFEEKIQLFNVEEAEGTIDLKIKIDKAFETTDKITKKFYDKFRNVHEKLQQAISGIADENDRHWYASVLLNRLMFIYFLQKNYVIQNDTDYLLNQFHKVAENAEDYYQDFLLPLFFLGFAKRDNEPAKKAFTEKYGQIVYLNGGLFQPHDLEQKYGTKNISVESDLLQEVLIFLNGYTWYLDTRPNKDENGINPSVLGFIFEKYINQKAFGAYYTRPEITEYLCRQSIQKLILDKINQEFGTLDINLEGFKNLQGLAEGQNFENFEQLIRQLSPKIAEKLIFDILPKLTLLDPSCGSGAFLIAMLQEMLYIYEKICLKIPQLNSPKLQQWLKEIEAKHALNYYLKKQIITQNIYGVDIMQEAVEIARLRLFLDLVSNIKATEIEPLPNIDFNIVTGNSLIGLLRVDAKTFEKRNPQKEVKAGGKVIKSANIFDTSTLVQGDIFSASRNKSYSQLIQEKEAAIAAYRNAENLGNEALLELKNSIREAQEKARNILNQILLEEFQNLGIPYQQATWDEKKQKLGKPEKRPLQLEDLEKLQPFHWGYEFSEVFRTKNGFDAIITNPPWEIVKPNAKEFFIDRLRHSKSSRLGMSDELEISKKKMSIKEFKKVEKALLKDENIKKDWLDYQSDFLHQSEWFRKAPQFKNQISIVNGRKAGTDINLYKLFTEQCYNLLKNEGFCGIVIPSGIYTDLGTKQLRKLLFEKTHITGLFCFENRKKIFEGVHRSFKFVVLGFEKGKTTQSFPAKFMRHEVEELENFPDKNSVQIDKSLIQKLSPDSFSIPEFKNDLDFRIAEKMIKFPLLGENLENTWNLKLGNEFHMTNDSDLFHPASDFPSLQDLESLKNKGFLPLFEGKMIHQFRSDFAEPRYWVKESEGRKAVLGARGEDIGQVLDYQNYRLGFRDVARNTDERTFIATILPKNVFVGNTINLTKGEHQAINLVCLSGFLNSFICDYQMRQKITSHCNLFYTYQNFVPRLQQGDAYFSEVVSMSAVLVCYDDSGNLIEAYRELWEEVRNDFPSFQNLESLKLRKLSKSDLRAKLDALVAKIYGLSSEELEYILSTFPIVEESQKAKVLEEFGRI